MSEEARLISIIFKRYDLIARQSSGAVEAIFDGSTYTRFDDWEPLSVQGLEYVHREMEAAKLITGFKYEIFNPIIQVRDRAALALFYIHYSGQIRVRPFDVWARVTVLLTRDDEWKIWHEHISRFPAKPSITLQPVERAGPYEPAAEVQKPVVDSVSAAIMEILKDGKDRDPVDLTIILPDRLGHYVDSSEVKKRCEELVNLGLLERVGQEGLLAKYRLKQTRSTQP